MKLKSGLHVVNNVGADHFEAPPTSSERALLAAILERATRDLGITACHYTRKKALEWFTAKKHESSFSNFSYRDIISYLGLGFKEVEELNHKIKLGKELNSNSKTNYKPW